MKRQDRWREILPMMVNNFFLYNDQTQRIDSCSFDEYGKLVNIQTSLRLHKIKFDSIATVLPLWRPVDNGVIDPALPLEDQPAISDVQVYVNSDKFPVVKEAPKPPEEITPEEILKSKTLDMLRHQEDLSVKLEEKLFEAIRSVKDSPNNVPQANQVSKAANEIIKNQMHTLNVFKFAKDLIGTESKNKKQSENENKGAGGSNESDRDTSQNAG